MTAETQNEMLFNEVDELIEQGSSCIGKINPTNMDQYEEGVRLIAEAKSKLEGIRPPFDAKQYQKRQILIETCDDLLKVWTYKYAVLTATREKPEYNRAAIMLSHIPEYKDAEKLRQEYAALAAEEQKQQEENYRREVAQILHTTRLNTPKMLCFAVFVTVLGMLGSILLIAKGLSFLTLFVSLALSTLLCTVPLILAKQPLTSAARDAGETAYKILWILYNVVLIGFDLYLKGFSGMTVFLIVAFALIWMRQLSFYLHHYQDPCKTLRMRIVRRVYLAILRLKML